MQLESLVIPLKIEDGVKGALLGIGAAVTAFVGLATAAVAATTEWANEMDALGDVTGMANDELAAWAYTARKAGVSTDKLTKGMVIFNKGIVKADGTLDILGQRMAEFGVNVLDSNGQVKDQSDLLAEISRKYNSFSTQQEKVNFLTEAFGKSGADLIDVFDVMAAEGGIDAVTEKVQELGLVLDPSLFENFGRTIEEIKLTFLGLASVFTGPLMGPLQRIVDTFKEWLQSPWVQEGIAKIGGAIGRLLEGIATGLETGDWTQLWDELNGLWDKAKVILDEFVVKATEWAEDPKNLTGFINAIIDALTGETESQASKPSNWIGLGKAIIKAILAADWYKIPEKLQKEFSFKKIEIDFEVPDWVKVVMPLATITSGIFLLAGAVSFLTQVGSAFPALASLDTMLMALMGALGPGGWVLVGISNLGAAFLGLFGIVITTTTPVWVTLAAGIVVVAALAAAVYLLWKNWDKVSEILKKTQVLFDDLKVFFEVWKENVILIFKAFWALMQGDFETAGINLGQALRNTFNLLEDISEGRFKSLGEIWKFGLDDLFLLLTGSNNWEEAGRKIFTLISRGLNYGLDDLFRGILSRIGDLASRIAQLMSGINIGLNMEEPEVAPPTGSGRPGGNGGATPRASGGPVIAGQTYSVAEFSRPEIFTPNKSGRIDGKKDQTITVDIDYNRLGKTFATELQKILV